MTELNWKIIDRYLAGEASDAERTLVEQWLAESPDFREFVKSFHEANLDDITVRSEQKIVEARLNRDIAAATRHANLRRMPQRIATAIKTRGITVLRAAAIATLLLGGSLISLQVARNTDPARINLARSVMTKPGERTKFTLPDGSKVILSPGSRLDFTTGIGTSARREVRLDGEAYFDVRHDRTRPFVVRAGNLLAEDLGTQFVVRAYPEDEYGRVIVREGLVGIGGKIVSPGEIGWISAAGTAIVKSVDVSSWFAWTEGRLVFDGMPLRDALPKLSRWYGRELGLANPELGEITLVATLPEHPADDAINAVALALGLHLEDRDGVLTFAPNPPTAPPRP